VASLSGLVSPPESRQDGPAEVRLGGHGDRGRAASRKGAGHASLAQSSRPDGPPRAEPRNARDLRRPSPSAGASSRENGRLERCPALRCAVAPDRGLDERGAWGRSSGPAPGRPHEWLADSEHRSGAWDRSLGIMFAWSLIHLPSEDDGCCRGGPVWPPWEGGGPVRRFPPPRAATQGRPYNTHPFHSDPFSGSVKRSSESC
jgi:hypothetical protein